MTIHISSSVGSSVMTIRTNYFTLGNFCFDVLNGVGVVHHSVDIRNLVIGHMIEF
jgi:hypothetical protein